LKLIAWQENKVDDIVRLWNQELGNDFPMRRVLFLQNSFHDINVYYEGSQLAVDNDGRVIGFIIAKKWQDSLMLICPIKLDGFKHLLWIRNIKVSKLVRSFYDMQKQH